MNDYYKIYRAKVVAVEGNKVKIRIPNFHGLNSTLGSIPDKNLPYATYCSPYKDSPMPSVGDIVYVSYEEANNSKPVVLGFLKI